jgi:PAS domain S-box-containing protein
MSSDVNCRQLIETIPHIVWTASETGAITFFNGRWTEATGLSQAQGLGSGFLQAIHSDDCDRIQASWQQAVESGHPYEAKFRMRKADGAYHRVIARAQIERAKDSSQPAEWVGTFTDIESIVYSKDDLVRKQQFLEALLENLSDGIVACDENGTLTLFNTASQTFHGLPAEPLPAERWADFYDLYDADLSPLRQEDIPLFRALQGETVRGAKIRIVPKNGKAHMLISSGAPILHPDGHQLGAVVAMRDITEQEQAEEALRASERRFRAIFNQTFQFIGLLEPDGTLLEVNQTALDFGGFTAQTVVGRPFWEAQWWSLSNEIRVKLQHAIALAAAGEFVRYDVEVLGANDEIISIDFSLKPIADEGGNIVLLIAEGRDITHSKKAEAEVYRLNALLEQRVAQRTAELEAKNFQNELLLVSEQSARAEMEAAIAQTATYTERLTLSLEAAQMGTWDWDITTDQTIWDLRHEVIFGYQPGTPNRDYFDWERHIHPEDLEWIHQATHAARDNHKALAIQYRILWPDETLHWVDAKGRFVYDAAGRPIRMIGVVRDITARKQTEEALQTSEDRFRRAIMDSPIPIILHAEDGEVVLINTAWTEFSGYQLQEIPTLADWAERAYGERKELVKETIDNPYSIDAKVREGEFTIRTRSGEMRTWDFSSAPLGQLSDGRRLVISTALDITDRKWAEQALRYGEARYRSLIEATSQITWTTNPEGELFTQQLGWENFTGQNFEAYKGWGWLTAIHPEDQPATAHAWTTAVESHTIFSFEHRIRRNDGEYRHMQVRGIPVFEEDGSVREWVGAHSDITEQKQYEEALRDSQEQFKATFEQAAVGIAHVDLDGRWIRVNQKLCEIVGYSAAELRDRTFQDLTHPDDLKADLAYVQQLIAGKVETYSIEKRYFHKSGQIVWVELTASLVRKPVEEHQDLDSELRTPQYFISVIEEINDRKQDQATLQARSRELSNFNGLLAQAAVLLDERNQELDRFVHIVSHDLKAPLRAISNLSQWIEEDLDGQLPPENQQQMALLRDRVSRMEAMINGLLDYARAGRTDAVIEPVPVAELLAEVVDSLAPPKTFSIEIVPEMPTLQTKRLLLSQVFANLISNGIKHHDRPDGFIRISSQDQGSFYEFAVADDGSGIAPEQHDKIFTIFQTVNPQNNPDSSGIGLSIVKKIVETEEGTIRLESEMGKGTIFYFTWPKDP